MANIAKMKRDRMLAFLEELKLQHNDDETIRAFNEIENHIRDKKYGLIWEDHTEQVDEMLEENIPVLVEDPERRLCKDENLPWNFIIEGDNLQALYLLEKTHHGKIDCIYIDPPYNTGARDWKYNNDYVGKEDVYRHSKWLSMMKNRLLIARLLLNPEDSVLIITIDEKEYLHLGCLLEEMFPTATITMATDVINPRAGVARSGSFTRTQEYIFFVQIGNSAVAPEKIEGEIKKNPIWFSLMRTGSNSSRADRPNLFYPVWAYPNGKLHSVGDAIPLETDRRTVVAPNDQVVAIWPIRPDGSENRWQLGKESLMKAFAEGTARINYHAKKYTVNYLRSAELSRIKTGEIIVKGRDENGALILEQNSDFGKTKAPDSVWSKPSHDAGIYGSTMLNAFFAEKRFSFPKSLYAVSDALRFVVAEKPNAIIFDFFAGSGTTLQAVNLLNAEDGGKRTCILATNNEISSEEEKDFLKRGIEKGSEEWESHGIARYVTWPRTVCSINGVDVNGNALKGEYLGSNIPMSNGFKANVKYMKCDWTARKPDDYLLSNVLCLHIKEMIELQNGYEIDGIKNVLILTKDDFNKVILDVSIYEQIENIWLNQNMILNAEEMKLLTAKGFKYIPREFFGKELREAAE